MLFPWQAFVGGRRGGRGPFCFVKYQNRGWGPQAGKAVGRKGTRRYGRMWKACPDGAREAPDMLAEPRLPPQFLYSSPRFLKVALVLLAFFVEHSRKGYVSGTQPGVLMPFSPPSKFYIPEGPGWMKPSQVPQRGQKYESLPHCLLAPQPIAHSIKTLMKLCWWYSIYYPAPLCYLLIRMKSRSQCSFCLQSQR